MARKKTLQDDGSIHGRCTLGLFDILGFRELVRRNGIDQLAALFGEQSDFRRMTDVAPRVGSEQHLVSRFKPAPCRVIRFSDTILLCSPDDGERGFVSVVNASVGLVGSALLSGILLRGAITRGDMHISKDQSTYVGPALVRASDLEKQQKWVGAIIDEQEFPAGPPKYMSTETTIDLWTVHYPAPRANAEAGESWCLNWAPIYASTSRRGLHADLLRHNPNPNPDALIKHENTKRFHDWAIARWNALHPDFASMRDEPW